MNTLARSTDPIQSHEAARRAEAFAPKHGDRIVAGLLERGPSTAHQLERVTGLNYVQIDRRMKELVQAGRVRAVEIDGQALKAATPTGGQAQVWEARR